MKFDNGKVLFYRRVSLHQWWGWECGSTNLISDTAEDTPGNRLNINGPVSLGLDTYALNIPANDNWNPGAKLWVLDIDGSWTRPQPLTSRGQLRRRKRQAVTITADGSVSTVAAPWFNIDRPIFQGQRCYVKVSFCRRTFNRTGTRYTKK